MSKVYVYGDTDSVRGALRKLASKGFDVNERRKGLFSGTDVVLSHKGRSFVGRTSVERAAARLDKEQETKKD